MSRSTTDQPTQRAGPAGDGTSDWPFRLEAPRRRIQVPQLLIAAFLVALGALIAVVLFSSASAREPVLALAEPLARGQVVTGDEVMIVYVASDDPIATLPSGEASSLVGSTAVADLEEGTILTSAHFASRHFVADGEGVIGLALSPGQYPTLSLAPGDRVRVVSTDRSVDGGSSAGQVIATAEVFDIAELGIQGERFVSLRLPVELTSAVAAAADTGQVRLILLGGSGS